jgi:hypothetical protein
MSVAILVARTLIAGREACVTSNHWHRLIRILQIKKYTRVSLLTHRTIVLWYFVLVGMREDAAHEDWNQETPEKGSSKLPSELTFCIVLLQMTTMIMFSSSCRISNE